MKRKVSFRGKFPSFLVAFAVEQKEYNSLGCMGLDYFQSCVGERVSYPPGRLKVPTGLYVYSGIGDEVFGSKK